MIKRLLWDKNIMNAIRNCKSNFLKNVKPHLRVDRKEKKTGISTIIFLSFLYGKIINDIKARDRFQ